MTRQRRPKQDNRTQSLFPDQPAPGKSPAKKKQKVRYETDEDGFLREIVGSWVHDKHARLARYVKISGQSVRRKWLGPRNAGATFIDLFSGPARVRIADTTEILPGSPLVAWQESMSDGTPFREVYVSDANPELTRAAAVRLRREGATVIPHAGPAIETVDRILRSVNPYALHLAFLDPYNLESLHFDIIRKLATLARMDILIHVSVQDLNRNVRRYVIQECSPLDAFVPGWRDQVDIARSDQHVRAQIFDYWRKLLQGIAMNTAEVAELVTGSTEQPLYWLAFAARHRLALHFWEQIRHLTPEPQTSLA